MKEQLIALLEQSHKLNMAIIDHKMCELSIMSEKSHDFETRYAVSLAKVSLEEVRGAMINHLSDVLDGLK